MLRLLTGIAVAAVVLVAAGAWWLHNAPIVAYGPPDEARPGSIAPVETAPASQAPAIADERERLARLEEQRAQAERRESDERAKAEAEARAQLATAMLEAEAARLREADERQRSGLQQRRRSGTGTAGGSPGSPGSGGSGFGNAGGGSSGTGSAAAGSAAGGSSLITGAGPGGGQAGASAGQPAAKNPFSLSSLSPAPLREPVAVDAAPPAPAAPSPPTFDAKRVKTETIRVTPQTTSPSAVTPAPAGPGVAAVAQAAEPPAPPPPAPPSAATPSRAGRPLIVQAAVEAAPAAPPAPALPEFQWPPPAASAWVVIPDDLIARRAQSRPSFGDVRDRLGRALDAAGYSQRTFFSVPNGFAIVTQLERIGDDGVPTSARRWFTAGSTEIFSLEEYLKRLLFAEAGRYRLVVLVVTDVSIAATGPYISAGEAAELADNGVMDLPPSVAAMEFSADHRATALIYEFRKRRTGDPEFVKRSPLPGRDHLVKARIWAAIENLRTR